MDPGLAAVSYRNRYVPAADPFAALWHTANPLPDGNVLVVGGWRGGPSPSARFDVFDALGRRFHAAGRLRVARQYHRTVTLHDGRLLVTGGDAWRVAPPSAEIIQPGSGRVEDTGAPVEGRSDHTATVLKDGRVLLVGGLSAGSEHPAASATAEAWDPSTGEFSLVPGTLAIPRVGHAASLLADGRVLIVGGWTTGKAYVPAELFDPATGRFSIVPCPDARPRKGHATVQLEDGAVLAIGGSVAGGDADAGWLPDPSVLRFYADGTGAEFMVPLAVPRAMAPAAGGPDGRAWLFGGMAGWEPSARAETYRPEEGSVRIECLPAPRYNHTVTPLADGRFLVAGGENAWTELVAEALIYE